MAAALTEHAALIASEVLAVDFESDAPGASGASGSPGASAADVSEHVYPDLGLRFWISV
jgi:hypothetical protein